MIYGDSCWVYNTCVKHKNGECPHAPSQYCPRLFRLNELYSQSLLTEKQYRPVTLYPDNTESEKLAFEKLNQIKTNIESFVSNGGSLYIYSPYAGNGKTSWAIKLMQAYFSAIWHKTIECSALFINVPRFLMELKASMNAPNSYIDFIKEHIYDANLIVWDDIGTKIGSEYDVETLLSYINARIDSGKANVYTSNLAPDALFDALGGRLCSRIISTGKVVRLLGQDKRGL